jgi:sporulation protein YlmC with PRC-barrel domain
MNDQGIHRFALLFMAVAAAVTSNLWAQHDHAPQRTADTTLAEWLTDKDARLSELIGATVVDDAGDSIGEIKDFVVSTDEHRMRAVVGINKDAGAAGGRLVAVPFDALHIELGGEEARALPQQARVRVDLGGAPIEALPAYEYPQREAI